MKVEDFALAWRWTDPRHTVLPASVLAQMAPLASEEAKCAFDRVRTVARNSGVVTSAEVSNEDGTQWLRRQHGGLSDLVTIWWSSGLALRTSWAIFTEYWSDFCYPGSDDIVVSVDSAVWTLFYAHEETFEFQKEPNKSTQTTRAFGPRV